MLDLIAAYPNAHTAFIGLFMVAKEEQESRQEAKSSVSCSNTQTGRLLDSKTCLCQNQSAERAFLEKNGFVLTGEEKDQGDYTVALMEKDAVKQ